MIGRFFYALAVFVASMTAGVACAAGPVRVRATTSGVRPLVQRLSLQQLAGQRIIYAYAGLRPPQSLLAAIRAGEAGGVIFFTPNISSVGQLRGVISELQQASLASPLHDRLLMLTDQEGGEVRRLPGAPILSEKQIGESPGGVSGAASAGVGAGRNLRGAGLNVNLAPVLDVFRQSGNFIDEFQRSYSSNPNTVAALGAAFISAQQHLGVRGDRQALPRARRGFTQSEHRSAAGHASAVAVDAARGRRGALRQGDRGGREARDDLLGGVSGARPEPAGGSVRRR